MYSSTKYLVRSLGLEKVLTDHVCTLVLLNLVLNFVSAVASPHTSITAVCTTVFILLLNIVLNLVIRSGDLSYSCTSTYVGTPCIRIRQVLYNHVPRAFSRGILNLVGYPEYEPEYKVPVVA